MSRGKQYLEPSTEHVEYNKAGTENEYDTENKVHLFYIKRRESGRRTATYGAHSAEKMNADADIRFFCTIWRTKCYRKTSAYKGK